MDLTKVLEILSKHIIKLEEENHFKQLKIENLEQKIKDIELHINDYMTSEVD